MLVGWLTIFLVGTDLFVVSPFFPQIGRELGLAPAQLALMVSLFGISYAIACPLQGYVAERVGVPRVLLFGICTIAVANALTALSTSAAALFASRMLAGLGAASISPMLYALVAQRSASNQRASKLARINSGLVIALFLGAPLGLLLGSHFGWRQVFGLLALAFALMFALNRLIWKADPQHARPSPPHAGTDAPLRAAIPYLVCMVLWGASVYCAYTMLATALDAGCRLSAANVALVLSAFGLGATLGSLLGGRVADRIGAVQTVRLCFVLMVCANACLYLVWQSCALWALLPGMFVVALVAYGFFPALQASASGRFTARRPTVMGLLSSGLYIGITTGAAGGGLVYSAAAMPGVIALAAALALAGAAVAALFLDTHPGPGSRVPPRRPAAGGCVY